MEIIYTELALYGSNKLCARNDTVFLPISEVCNDMVSLTNCRAVASVENVPNLGAFSGAHDMQAKEIRVLYHCEFCHSGACWGH